MDYVIGFNKAPSCYWSEHAKIEHLQRRILLYSYMYYKMNVNVVSDYDYDAICYQLVDMQSKADPKALKRTKYYYVFKDFDGHTGFHLISGLTNTDRCYIDGLANMVYDAYESATTPEQRILLSKGLYHPKSYIN